ncbi:MULTISPECIES: hypothetical protein [Rhizobium]|jgi:hypothetical protein|uniref:Uncharacterized protein n=1 Tax=Rhizobium anhuiense TaxID=1184720 RepID=A0A3S0QGC6_9HYPH|nr:MULTISPECIES: hypothetical protein [Rhizobium]MBB3297100.1 hypothetical protein [Rhizobium sp. BK112]MBB3366315.1 hypothetical protein [Rhizobium sp. BK077]MBB3741292.1 hypothetical protein [Rhizobium sp. BK591]MBB4111000.1 hypothetical protein [Rhizobium sp. BK226]MBB4176993.1 hypothetical protein [Rhizobium sp. BK109]
MDISFKTHSPWPIGKKAAETGTVNEFSSKGSILDFHSFAMNASLYGLHTKPLGTTEDAAPKGVTELP